MAKEKKPEKDPEPEMTFRERILRELYDSGVDIPKREISVMTRLGGEVVEILDALVKLNLFKSRSEVVAAIVEKKILSNLELFNSIKKQAEKLQEIHDELESMTFEVFRE